MLAMPDVGSGEISEEQPIMVKDRGELSEPGVKMLVTTSFFSASSIYHKKVYLKQTKHMSESYTCHLLCLFFSQITGNNNEIND